MLTAPAIALAMAMMTPPPEPPPPPDRLAAAAELRRAAPLTGEMQHWLVDQSALRATYTMFGPGLPDSYEKVSRAKALIVSAVEAHRTEIELHVAGCLDEHLGHSFDVEALREMTAAVATKGGFLLWSQAIREPAQTCYDQALAYALTRDLPAISWLVRHDLLGRVPSYNPARGDAGFARDLETLCGPKARGVVQSRSGRLGVTTRWMDRDLRRGNGDTFACLTSAAKVAGHELSVID